MPSPSTFIFLNMAVPAISVEPEPVQRPRPPLTIAASGKKALRVVAERADVWVSGPGDGTREEGLRIYRERSRLLDNHCMAIGRDPRTIERACLTGWSESDPPFVSAGAFQDFVGRYRDSGVQRFVFSFGSAAVSGYYQKWVAARAWASREVLDPFAAQAMADIRHASSA